METPNYEKVILQQPISQEHSIILRRICESANIPIDSVYITSIVKCECKPKTNDYAACIENNLNIELEELKPYKIFVCGSGLATRYRKFGKLEFMELPCMTTLLGTKAGRTRLTDIFKALNRE